MSSEHLFRNARDDVVGMEHKMSRTPYSRMTDETVKETARRIIRNSISKEEVEHKMHQEMPGYPGGMALTSHKATDELSENARSIVQALGGLTFKDGSMVMAMIHGPRGNTISL
jgi:hypothetical protein